MGTSDEAMGSLADGSLERSWAAVRPERGSWAWGAISERGTRTNVGWRPLPLTPIWRGRRDEG